MSPAASLSTVASLSLAICQFIAFPAHAFLLRSSTHRRQHRTAAGGLIMSSAANGQTPWRPPLIVGSKSKTRRQILTEMGFDLHLESADIDEKQVGDRASCPSELVLEVAKAKAQALLDKLANTESPYRILLTGDQVVVWKGRIREKPHDGAEAREFIEGYGRSPCQTVGSCVLTDLHTRTQVSGVDTATIHIKPIPDDIIQKLIDEGDILHCAGGLMIEHPLVEPYIERIDGAFDSVLGLSKALVDSLLIDLRQKIDTHASSA